MIGLETTGPDGDATIVNATGIDFKTTDVEGDLDATATTGDITDAGTVTVAGMAQFNTLAAGADIDLESTGRHRNDRPRYDGPGGDATIVNATGIDFKTTDVEGDLDATATTGDITDAGTVTVAGMAQFNTLAAGADIDLNLLAVTGMIGLDTTGPGGDATIVNATGIDFKTTDVEGDLDATATTGDITDAGTVTVAGMAQFNTLAAGADIDLDLLAVTGMIGLATTGPGGDATIVNATGIDFKTTDVEGDLDATATTGDITDAGTVTVAGMAQFNTLAAGADIDLDLLAVTGMIGLETTGPGGDATIVNATGIDFKTTDVEGDLDATATTGDITDAGTVTVAGMAQFNTQAAGADIDLNLLAVTGMIGLDTTGPGGDATIVNATGIDFKTTDVEGDLDATATTGDITDAAGTTIVVTGGAAFHAAESIVLANMAGDTLAVGGDALFLSSGKESIDVGVGGAGTDSGAAVNFGLLSFESGGDGDGDTVDDGLVRIDQR